MGAVAIKQSVYVMPLSKQSREDLSRTLKKIVEGGGDGSISEARFVEELSDERIVAQFYNARRAVMITFDIVSKSARMNGDTITVLRQSDKTQYKIRLYGIDCPESHQDFGTRAKQSA